MKIILEWNISSIYIFIDHDVQLVNDFLFFTLWLNVAVCVDDQD